MARLLLAAFILALIHLSRTQTDICKDKSSAKKSILCIGKLRDRLLMITKPDEHKDQLVYDLPLDSINGSMNKLYITGDKPKTIKEKWPELYNFSLYAQLVFGDQSYIYNSFVALDQISEYLLLTTKSKSGHQGVVFDINSHNVSKGLSYGGASDQVLISSQDLNHFYAIQRGDKDGLTIMRYHFTGDNVMDSCQKQFDSIVPDEPVDFYPICKVGADKLMVLRKKVANSTSTNMTTTAPTACDPMLWPKGSDLLKGFVTKEKFYLFGDDDIYILPSQFYEQANTAFHYDKVEYANFIECSANVIVIKNKGLGVGIIVAIILVVLILVLVACLLCFREVQKRGKHKHKHHSKHQVGKPSTKGKGSSIGEAQSVRSTNISNINDGKLSTVGPAMTGRSALSGVNGPAMSGAFSGAITGRSIANDAALPQASKLTSNAASGRSALSGVNGPAVSGAFSGAITGRSSATGVGLPQASKLTSNAITGRSGVSNANSTFHHGGASSEVASKQTRRSIN